MVSPEPRSAGTSALGGDEAYRKFRDALCETSLTSVEEASQMLRIVLHELVNDARERGLQAEHAVVLVKRAWNEVPLDRLPPAVSGRVPLLDRLISIAVETFYRPK